MISVARSALQSIMDNPILAKPHGIILYWYGLFVATGYTAAGAVILWHVSKWHSEYTIAYSRLLCMMSLPGAIFGARLCSFILEDHCDWRKAFRPGFWWHGGLAGLVVATFAGSAAMKLPLRPLVDSLGLGMPTFEVFNRLGCISYGCCWGGPAPESSLLRIRFNSPSSCIHRKKDPLRNDFLYPVQLYASGLSVVQSAVLLGLASAYRMPDGSLFALSMALCACVRLFCERFRADFRGSGYISCSAFALYQAAFGVATFLAIQAQLHAWDSAGNDGEPLVEIQSGPLALLHAPVGMNLGFAFALAFVTYGVHVDPQANKNAE